METKTMEVTFMSVQEFRTIMARELGWETFDYVLLGNPDNRRTLLQVKTNYKLELEDRDYNILAVLLDIQTPDGYGQPGLQTYGVELVLAELASAGVIPKTDYVLTEL